MHYRRVQVVCATSTLCHELRRRGIASDHCHLIRPGVDFARVRGRRDTALRQALGLCDQDRVILAPGESTRAASHRTALWTGGILNLLDPRYKLLLWGRGREVSSIQRFASRIRHTDLLFLALRRLGRCVGFEELLPAADLALVTASGPVPTLPVASCMAAGLPIVSTITYTLSELLEDHHTALLVSRPSPRLLAQKILELFEDARLRWELSDRARSEAFDYFAMTRFLDQHRTLYRQVASGQDVHLPDPATSSGMRFSVQI
jgi:glycosyltransferase involved in cell wall biosynthesis